MDKEAILKALRGAAGVTDNTFLTEWITPEICAAAADEIERLNARIAELEESVETARADGWEDGHSAALEEK